jgi:hypothetical protein
MKKNIKLNQPIYLGMTILDNSKLIMQDYWYNHLEPLYGY